jgi:hypothetical protein
MRRPDLLGLLIVSSVGLATAATGQTEPAVSMAISSNGGPPKVVNASPAGSGRYTVSVPSPAGVAGGPLELTMSDGSGTTTLRVRDQTLRIGAQTIRLSDIRTIEKGSGVKTTLQSGRVLPGPVTGLTAITADVKGITARLDLGGNSSISVAPAAAATGITRFGWTSRSSGVTPGMPPPQCDTWA